MVFNSSNPVISRQTIVVNIPLVYRNPSSDLPVGSPVRVVFLCTGALRFRYPTAPRVQTSPRREIQSPLFFPLVRANRTSTRARDETEADQSRAKAKIANYYCQNGKNDKIIAPKAGRSPSGFVSENNNHTRLSLTRQAYECTNRIITIAPMITTRRSRCRGSVNKAKRFGRFF